VKLCRLYAGDETPEAVECRHSRRGESLVQSLAVIETCHDDAFTMMLKKARGWKEPDRKVRLARATCFLFEQQSWNVTQAWRYKDQRTCVLLCSALLRWRSSRRFTAPMVVKVTSSFVQTRCVHLLSPHIPRPHGWTPPHFSGCACAGMILRVC
jgi:hypothetical protein